MTTRNVCEHCSYQSRFAAILDTKWPTSRSFQQSLFSRKCVMQLCQPSPFFHSIIPIEANRPLNSPMSKPLFALHKIAGLCDSHGILLGFVGHSGCHDEAN
ncbi:hypothetical protein DdX_14596 [Ditylenchus destructor]|uniref:Uncharacterized protein n=1 Tax=Ditylenchus destructor TaxID=166010 RepID=A0AAD4R1Q8_9BILA|nr:hypothetical protein DdX_14596 [Ditylenchus destructor]